MNTNDNKSEIILCPFCKMQYSEKVTKCVCGYYFDKDAYLKKEEIDTKEDILKKPPKIIRNTAIAMIIGGLLLIILQSIGMSLSLILVSEMQLFLGVIIILAVIIPSILYVISGIFLIKGLYWSRVFYLVIAILGSIITIIMFLMSLQTVIIVLLFPIIVPLFFLFSEKASLYFKCLKENRLKRKNSFNE